MPARLLPTPAHLRTGGTAEVELAPDLQILAALMDTGLGAPEAAEGATRTAIDDYACGQCGYEGLDQVDGYFYCAECGHTKGHVVDGGAEWRYSADGRNDNSRCGMPTNPLLPRSSLATVIVGGSNTYMKKLHRWNSSNHRESARYKIFLMIQGQAARKGVNSAVVHQAQKYVVEVCNRMIEADNVLRGPNRRGVFAACLHFAFKKLGCPRSAGEIAEIMDVPLSCVAGGIKAFGDMLGDAAIVSGDTQIDPADLMPRVCSKLGLPVAVQAAAARALRKLAKLGTLRCHIPEAQAAACLWYVLKSTPLAHQVTKRAVGEACGVSDVTIAKCCKKVETALLAPKGASHQTRA